MRKKKTRQRTITGMVVPEDWDSKDRLTRVGIKTSDFREFIVEHNKNGRELMALVNQRVCVRGKVRERLDGEFMLSVESYEVVKDEWEDRHVA
jgi:hypothetical protein